MRRQPWRIVILVAAAIIILAPVAIIVYQSFLSAPFFNARSSLSLDAYRFVWSDDDFFDALINSIILALSMAAIAVPLGSVLAYLLVRTDLPGRRLVEPLALIPLFISPMVLAFGYVVSLGPVGFLTVAWTQYFGTAPWNIYSLVSMALIVGLTHVPHVYLYVSASLRTVPSDLEEAARIAGAGPWKVATTVTLPMALPSIGASALLIFFLGFELFGLPYVLGDPDGRFVLSTYLYKLAYRLGTPSYQLMAVVAATIMVVTLPVVALQRRVLKNIDRYTTIRGKPTAPRIIQLGGWRWVALAGICLWLFAIAIIPLTGIGLRSIVKSWGIGINVLDVLTTRNYTELAGMRSVGHSIINTLILGTLGAALSIIVYATLTLTMHRWPTWWTRVFEHLVLLPRAMPGIVAGLAMFWLFLFFAPLKPYLNTLVSVWLAYTLVWMPFGLRLISNAVNQIGPELEEAAHIAGAGQARTARDVILPLARHGLMAAWLLTFLLFVREYSTGIYLMAPGSEVMGSMLVNLWSAGNIDVVSALSVINTITIAVGIGIALKLGVALGE